MSVFVKARSALAEKSNMCQPIRWPSLFTDQPEKKLGPQKFPYRKYMQQYIFTHLLGLGTTIVHETVQIPFQKEMFKQIKAML